MFYGDISSVIALQQDNIALAKLPPTGSRVSIRTCCCAAFWPIACWILVATILKKNAHPGVCFKVKTQKPTRFKFFFQFHIFYRLRSSPCLKPMLSSHTQPWHNWSKLKKQLIKLQRKSNGTCSEIKICRHWFSVKYFYVFHIWCQCNGWWSRESTGKNNGTTQKTIPTANDAQKSGESWIHFLVSVCMCQYISACRDTANTWNTTQRNSLWIHLKFLEAFWKKAEITRLG